MATGIGETLRQARQERDLSLEDASAETRIRATHLAALEQEDFARLGGEVYVRGFIRSYAKVLGVDPDPLLAQHQPAAPDRPAAEPSPLPLGQEPIMRTQRRGLGIAVAGLALLAIIGLAVWGGDDADRVDMDDDPLTDAEGEEGNEGDEGDEGDDAEEEIGETAPTPTPTPTEPPADTAEQAGTVEGVEVILEIVDRQVWLRALVDGDEVMEETLSPGDSETFAGDEEVRLRLGDAGAVELVVNGESVGAPGADGEPLWVTIDADGEVTLG